MKSQNIKHIPGLDHLRLLAALLVFSFHLFHLNFGKWQPTPNVPLMGFVTEGHTGVSLFFVLSGFLFMCIALQGEGIRYGDFMRNRFLRIFPLFVFFFFIAISLSRDEFRSADIFYLFFSNLGLAPTSNWSITGAAWTISVEFTFYMVFPFLAHFVRKEGWVYLLRLIALMALVKLAAYGLSAKPTHMFYSTLIGRFDQFLWGMFAAVLWTQHREWFQRHGKWLLILAGVAAFAALAWQARNASYFLPQARQPIWLYWGTIEALMWSALVLGYLGANIRWPTPVARAMEMGGDWSYSLYLWHGMLLYVVQNYFGIWRPFDTVALNAMVNFCLLLPPTLALSALSYHTLERPFLQLRGPYMRTGGA